MEKTQQLSRSLCKIFLVFGFIFNYQGLMASSFQGSELVVSAACPYAVQVGKKTAERGGNPVDVAVAMLLTMAVTSPSFGGLGGGGFALIKMDDSVQVLDFREVAPKKSTPDMYLKLPEKASREGGAAVAVPGTVAGLWALHDRYGKVSWRSLFKEPIQMARRGFRVSGEWVENTQRAESKFTDVAKSYFMKKGENDDHVHYQPGEAIKQVRLARALRLIRARRAQGFYTGQVANDVVSSVQEAGGKLTLDDLKNYKVKWREPITSEYRDYKLYLMPPPSSGGVIIKMLFSLAEKVGLANKPPLSTDEFHTLGMIQSRAFRARTLLADPDFHNNPIEKLIDDEELKTLAKTISPRRVTSLPPLEETSHLSVLNNEGQGVAVTFTLNASYGSGVVTKKYGIAMNNEMDDFTTQMGQPNLFGLIQGQGNRVQPGKRPLSSMSPTLVEKDGDLVLAIGAPGGPRIISSTFQALYRLLEQDMDLDRAIQAPRVHHQFLPDRLFIDGNHRVSPEIIDSLKTRGHDVSETTFMGKVFGVMKKNGTLHGAYDSRGAGAAGGF